MKLLIVCMTSLFLFVAAEKSPAAGSGSNAVVVPAFMGPDSVILNAYFDGIARKNGESFEAWYPVKSGKIPNPRTLSFDAAKALGGKWEKGRGTATLATYRSRMVYGEVIKVINNIDETMTWLRDVTNVGDSELLVRNPEDGAKIRMALTMPLLKDLSGYYNFKPTTVSNDRTVLRVKQMSEEGASDDTEMMVLVDRTKENTALIHIVYVIILKEKYANGFFTDFWFKFRSQRNIGALAKGLGLPSINRD